jgi:hypothetical protein
MNVFFAITGKSAIRRILGLVLSQSLSEQLDGTMHRFKARQQSSLQSLPAALANDPGHRLARGRGWRTGGPRTRRTA